MKGFRFVRLPLLLLALSNIAHAASSESALLEMPGVNGTNDALDLNNADIRDVLRLIADMYDLNMVMSDDVRGVVTVRLKDTSLANTLDALLTIRGYDYEIRDNIIRVAPATVIENERTQRHARQELEPLISEVIVLHYLDANDVRPMIVSMLSERGSITVLERRPFRGFQFGSSQSSTSSSTSSDSTAPSQGSFSGLLGGRNDSTSRSNTLMVVDIRPQIDRVKEVIKQIDVPPKQVLIDAKIVEVNAEVLDDLGLDFSGDASDKRVGDKYNRLRVAANNGETSNSVSDLALSNQNANIDTDAGIYAIFQRLDGEGFTATFHALMQDERTKVLSSPKILTIDNQEAAILVGEQFPIFEANVTDQGTTTESLSYFQPIGISLQVIAQVTPQNDINMIIHPTISSVGNFVTGTSGLTQPRINVREADTRVLVKDGETLVIGGLLEDVQEERYWRIPILGHIPLLEDLFTRRQVEVDQRNLLIFITPRVIQSTGTIESKKYAEEAIKKVNEAFRYALPHERKRLAKETFKAAKKNFENQKYRIAAEQFKTVIELEPGNEQAMAYLDKLPTLK